MNPNLSKWTDFALHNGVRVVAIVLIAIIMNRVLRALTRRLIETAGNNGLGRIARLREQHTRTLAGLLYSAGTAVILAGAVLMTLPEFGFNVTPIAAVAGLASLAVGFGAQHLVRDLINGFFSIIEDQYVVGDSVRIGTSSGAVIGRVEHLTLRRTVVRDVQGALVTVPNGEISQVANLSRDWSQIFVDISLPADGAMDIALSALERVCAELRNDAAWSPVLIDGPRVLGVESFGAAASAIRVQLRSIPGRQDDVARELRRRIQHHFEQEHIRWGDVQRVEVAGIDTTAEIHARSDS